MTARTQVCCKCFVFARTRLPTATEEIPLLVTDCIDVGDDGNCATDTIGDGLLNDVDGDISIADVQALFNQAVT
jgi:hypothetical protein